MGHVDNPCWLHWPSQELAPAGGKPGQAVQVHPETRLPARLARSSPLAHAINSAPPLCPATRPTTLPPMGVRPPSRPPAAAQEAQQLDVLGLDDLLQEGVGGRSCLLCWHGHGAPLLADAVHKTCQGAGPAVPAAWQQAPNPGDYRAQGKSGISPARPITCTAHHFIHQSCQVQAGSGAGPLAGLETWHMGDARVGEQVCR